MDKKTRIRSKSGRVNNKGATLVEYALMLTLILIFAYVGYVQLGKNVRESGDKSTMSFSNH